MIGAMKRVIIDTDPGVDDALALILALKSPELRVELITTVSGNVPVDLGTKNLFRLLSLLPPPHPPVARGSEGPGDSGGVHGSDGLGDIDPEKYPLPDAPPVIDLPAPEAILSLLRENPDEITLIALGPLTNIAKAIQVDPHTMRGLREIVAMLGAIRVPGNATPYAEFNCWFDPHAAQVVLNSGIPITLVGLDVTQKVVLEEGIIEERSREGGAIAQFVRDCTALYIKFHKTHNRINGCYLHDPLAVAVAIDPSLVKREEMSVRVETGEGPTRGRTMAESAPHNAKACLDVEAERFLKMFVGRVLGKTL